MVSAGWIEFASPGWLLLAPASWAFVWWTSRRSLDGVRRWSLWTPRALRCLLALLLAGALAEPTLARRSDRVAVVAVVDASASVPADGRDAALAWLAQAATAQRSPDDLLGVVVVGKSAVVGALPQRTLRAPMVDVVVDPDATDLGAGVRLALATLPSDAAGRIVLVSDGVDTEGGLLEAARAAAGAGVPIDTLPVRYRRQRETALEAIEAPPLARVDEPVTLRFLLRSTEPATGSLTLTIDDRPVDLDPSGPGLGAPIELQAGVNVRSIPLAFPTAGAHRLRAVFTPDDPAADGLAANNVAEAAVMATGEGRVLVLADAASGAEGLVQLLEEEGLAVETRSPEAAFDSLVDLAGYDAAALVDVPAYSLGRRQQEALRRYVHDLGGGLLVVGGPRSFGAGGWIGSPLADALPVGLDPPQKRQMPRGALAIVLDSSGSMAAPVAGVGTKQQAANEAAALAVASLSRLDLVTVIRFTGAHQVVVPLRERGDAAQIARMLRRVGPGGGTYIYGALEEAWRSLRGAKAAVKHVILLTDGQSTGSPMQGAQIARRMAEDGVSLSTVAVGDSADAQLLKGLADIGGGSFYELRTEAQLRQLPRIFIKEAQTIKRPLIWEGDPTPPIRLPVPAEPLRGITGALPPLTGHVVTAPREGLATTPLTTGQGDPLLALWQYGLGRAAAFTSDAGARWAASWRDWEGARPFWSQLLRWVMRPDEPANIRVRAHQQGERALVEVDIFDENGSPLTTGTLSGRAAHPDGSSEAFALVPVGPGRYEGAFPIAAAGAHLFSVQLELPGEGDGSGATATLRSAIVRRPALERRALRDNETLLRRAAQTTGGRTLALGEQVSLFARQGLRWPVARRPVWLWAAGLALTLLVVDVGARRVRLDLEAVRQALRRAIIRPSPVSATRVQRLRQARERAAAATRATTAQPHAPQPAPLDAAALAAARSTGANDAAGVEAAQPAPLAARGSAPALEEEPLEGLGRLLRAKRRAREALQQQTLNDDKELEP